MAIPQSISYAAIAGIPPAFGLYSDLQVFYPMLGTSKYLVVGPVAVMSLMTRTALQQALQDQGGEENSPEWIDLACFLSLAVSVVQFAFFVAGVNLAGFLPEVVVSAFASAAALIIASTQLTALLGIRNCENGCGFVATIYHVISKLDQVSSEVLVCSSISAALLLGFKRVSSSNIASKLGPLAVVTFGIAFVDLGIFQEQSIGVVGQIPQGLPTPRWFPTPPRDMYTLLRLSVSSIPMAIIGFAEANTIAKASTKLRGEDTSTISDQQEMFALAACNAFTAFVGGYPVTGSFSRTAINAESGARSPLATGIAALAVVFVLLFFTSPLSKLPKACIATIVVSCVIKLIDGHEFFKLVHRWKSRRDPSVFVFGLVFLLALVVGVEYALICGVMIHHFLDKALRVIPDRSKLEVI